jgi:hypothetical protein
MRDFSFKMQHMTNFSSDLQQIARKTAPDWKTEKYKNTNKSRKNIAPARNCMEVSPTFLQGECCTWHMPWHGPQDHDAWVDSGLQPCLAIWLCSTTLSTTSVWCWMAIIQTYNMIYTVTTCYYWDLGNYFPVKNLAAKNPRVSYPIQSKLKRSHFHGIRWILFGNPNMAIWMWVKIEDLGDHRC